MGGLATASSNDALKHQFKIATWTAPTNLYVAAFTTNPNYDGSGMEVSGFAYARINHNSWAETVVGTGAIENSGTITFPTATGSWGTVSYIAIYDALTVGNMLAFAQLTVSKSVTNTDILTFADASLFFTVT